MLFKERERFERTDVPTPSALRNMVSAGVLVLSVIFCLVLWRSLWNKANQMNYLNDDGLYDALYEQYEVSGPSGDLVWSDDSFSNCLLLVVDDIHAENPELTGAQIIVRNMDAGTAAVATLPVNTRLKTEEMTISASALFASEGATQVLPLLTDAANVHVSHVIVASSKIWDQLASFEGPTIRALLSRQTNDFYTISSDFSTGDLVEFAEWLQAAGIENFAQVEAEYSTETLEDGTEVAVIDRQALPAALGIFVAPEPEGEGE